MTDAHAPQRRTPAAVAAALALAVAANGCGGGGAPVAVQHGTLTLASAAPGWPQAGVIALATVARVGGADGEVSVSWSTADDTALAGRDYSARAGVVTWVDKDTAPKSIAVPVSASSAPSGALAFTLSLNTPTGGARLDASARTSMPLTAAWRWTPTADPVAPMASSSRP